MFVNHAYPADAPSYGEILNPITQGISAPSAIAVDSREKLYIAEPGYNRALIYSAGGRHLKTHTGLQSPISIAVDSLGRIIIGSGLTGSVDIYSAEMEQLFKLGAGAGEFEKPVALAVSSAGIIYVADSSSNEISAYNPDGTFNFKFGGSSAAAPTPAGKFNIPTALAIDETKGELIITDLQLILKSGGRMAGARVQIFSLTDLLNPAIEPKLPVRSFAPFGLDAGKLFSPKGVTVDTQGRIYITDSYQNIVQVFDGLGIYLGTVYDLTTPMRTPLGIAMGQSSRLYIASLKAPRVDIYGIGQYEQMQIAPLALAFQAQQGGAAPGLQSISITNTGKAALNWTASTGQDWITISETSGITEPGLTSTTGIGINPGGLAQGDYTGSIEITADSGMTETVETTLSITAPAELSIAPSSLQFLSIDRSIPAPEVITIDNKGAGTLNWSAASASAWLLIDKTSGAAPDTINAAVDITSLQPGTYYDIITITAEGAVGSPRLIPVKLDVIILQGTITVTTNLETATFTINGPQSYTASGMNWSASNAPAGTYVIVYGDVRKYNKPVSESKTLQGGGIIEFHGQYTKKTGKKQTNSIITGAGPGKQNPGKVQIINPDGTAGAAFIAHKYNYGAEVAAGDIDSDGIDEIITAPGPGAGNPAEINIFDNIGRPINQLSFTANQYRYGAYVASGDLDADGRYEIIIGAGAGAMNPAEVKVFTYDPLTDSLTDSGIQLLAYDTGYGVRVAAGDIDADGIDEIITAPGPGKTNTGLIRIWKADTSQGQGQWSTKFLSEFTVHSRYGYSVSIACGDTNGDSADEIITGEGPHPKAKDTINVFDMYGAALANFSAGVSKGYGANVAGGDTDADSFAEIITGAGPKPDTAAKIKIYNKYNLTAEYKAMKTNYGANIAAGNLGYGVTE